MIKQELTYWITLALIPKMWTKRKNEIYAKCFTHSPKISIIKLFEDKSVWNIIGLSETEKAEFEAAKDQLANNSFLVEELIDQGYDILPITHEDYPRVLKDNLKYNSPTVLFTKGNKDLLKEPSVAIVGSRSADEKSLTFTDNIAKMATAQGKVVISGFAKGVDRKALDSAIEANGKSIIVLPQGIMTFGSGFKQYFKHIVQGNVLVMSSFAPKAPWSVEFAMARNPIIYGMASEIYVAQSDNKGGTWSGVIDGLKRGRPIYVRCPDENEKNANLLLIEQGACAVDMNGYDLTQKLKEENSSKQAEKERFDSEIMTVLNNVVKISAKEMVTLLHLDWTTDQMRFYLDRLPEAERIKVNSRFYYRPKNRIESNMFSDQE